MSSHFFSLIVPYSHVYPVFFRDALSHAARRLSDERQLMLLENLTYLLQKTFRSQFVFPALGHDEPEYLKKELGQMWARWLPTDSLKTFEAGELENYNFIKHFIKLNQLLDILFLLEKIVNIDFNLHF